MKNKETPRCDGQWTEAKFVTFVKAQLRQGSMKWPPKNEVFKRSRIERGVYFCNSCKQNVPASIKINGKTTKNVYVDHISPIINPEIGFTSWDDFINALYCDSSNLQVMCLECHSKKTAEERRVSNERARIKKENNNE